MERKIGEIFEFNGEWYQCVKSPDESCKHCDMNFAGKCPIPIKECVASSRSDLSYVIFKKLEKVGEPFTIVGKLYQYYKVFDIDNVCGDGSWCIYNYNAKTLTIEIKQNKEEDMKTVRINKDDLNFLVNKIRYGILPRHTDCDAIIAEITDLFSVEDVNLSNSEKIGKNLREFDLEAAKSGKPVYTRDGRKARIICFDAKCNLPIIALVTNTGGNESLIRYYSNGSFTNLNKAGCDLMMLPEKKEGWVNVYHYDNDDSSNRGCRFIYDTKEQAVKEAGAGSAYITTVKISWEE